MADQRIVDYLSQNAGKYPLDALKAALVKQGFPEAEVEEAARQAAGAPAPAEPPPAPPADAVSFSPKNMFANAAALAKGPEAFFERVDPEGGYGPAVATIALWGLLSGLLTFLLTFAHQTPFGPAVGAAEIVLLPVLAVILSWLAAAIFHVVCLILGGKGTFKASYQLVAAMSALFPVSTLIGLVPFGVVPIQLVGLYLSVVGAARLHQVGRTKAWVAFGALTALGLVGTVIGQLQMGGRASPFAPPAAVGGAPQGIPPEAAAALGRLGGLEGKMTPEARKAMQEAMANPAAVLQEITKYGDMK
ncbi:MAG: YIP1 family protein, partial [Elusimicrobia bacterium]|nr:YIP1 family protein [Elusimicrobiota bacterium]